jgi:hypothetical protein
MRLDLLTTQVVTPGGANTAITTSGTSNTMTTTTGGTTSDLVTIDNQSSDRTYYYRYIPAPAYSRALGLETIFSPEYQHLESALFELRSSDDDQLKIEAPVYGASMQVAAMLVEQSVRQPTIFSHGPKSVVFTWSLNSNDLYITITANRMSILVSSREGIQRRVDITRPQVDKTDALFSALGAASRYLTFQPGEEP